MEYKLSIREDNYHVAVLTVMNIVSHLNLTPLEISIVAFIVRFNIEAIEKSTRDLLCECLGRGKFSINNAIKSLKDKGILNTYRDSKLLCVNPNLALAIKDSTTSFKFELV